MFKLIFSPPIHSPLCFPEMSMASDASPFQPSASSLQPPASGAPSSCSSYTSVLLAPSHDCTYFPLYMLRTCKLPLKTHNKGKQTRRDLHLWQVLLGPAQSRSPPPNQWSKPNTWPGGSGWASTPALWSMVVQDSAHYWLQLPGWASLSALSLGREACGWGFKLQRKGTWRRWKSQDEPWATLPPPPKHTPWSVFAASPLTWPLLPTCPAAPHIPDRPDRFSQLLAPRVSGLTSCPFGEFLFFNMKAIHVHWRIQKAGMSKRRTKTPIHFGESPGIFWWTSSCLFCVYTRSHL